MNENEIKSNLVFESLEKFNSDYSEKLAGYEIKKSKLLNEIEELKQCNSNEEDSKKKFIRMSCMKDLYIDLLELDKEIMEYKIEYLKTEKEVSNLLYQLSKNSNEKADEIINLFFYRSRKI